MLNAIPDEILLFSIAYTRQNFAYAVRLFQFAFSRMSTYRRVFVKKLVARLGINFTVHLCLKH